MDFMKIIKSLEQLLYELMVWVVFYPLTLWRALTSPLKLMDYADDEFENGTDDDERYSDTLSPPIFLAITLGLIHLFEIAEHLNVIEDGLLADHRNLIAFRLVVFALFPLMMSLRYLRMSELELDRSTLRPPFYAQCFIAAPFALAIDSAALLLAAEMGMVASIVMAGAAMWYLAVQTGWFARMLDITLPRAFWEAVRAFATAGVIALLVAAFVNQF